MTFKFRFTSKLEQPSFGVSAGRTKAAGKPPRPGLTLVALALLAAFIPCQAFAGGLGVREQSTQFLGTAFAGNAAGGGLSSMFWNSAALGEAKDGIWFDNSYSVIFGNIKFSDVTINDSAALGNAFGGGTNADHTAFLGVGYTSYRLNDKWVLGLATNTPFGLSSKPDKQGWGGQFHHRSSKLTTFNATPMASYEISPGLFVGAGVQIQYAHLKFKTASALNGPNATLLGSDVGFGYTAGVLWKPSSWTSLGVGFRSKVNHTIDGNFRIAGVGGTRSDFKSSLSTPETVTVSLRQNVTNDFRLLGTVEWTKWSRLKRHSIRTPSALVSDEAAFEFNWDDGLFFSVGGEYDYANWLTLRAGIAYENSPVNDPTQRIPQAPDADRLWLSAGLTYKISPTSEINLSYAHIFIDDERLSRFPASGAAIKLDADVDASVDIVSVGFKTKFDWFRSFWPSQTGYR